MQWNAVKCSEMPLWVYKFENHFVGSPYQPPSAPKRAKQNSNFCFLASQDALEVMRVTESLSHWVSVSIDFTDVTLVSDDT